MPGRDQCRNASASQFPVHKIYIAQELLTLSMPRHQPVILQEQKEFHTCGTLRALLESQTVEGLMLWTISVMLFTLWMLGFG